MKWLFVCLAVLCMVAPAFAGQDPYIAIVGKDCVTGDTNPLQEGACSAGAANSFYFSPKHRLFMYDENADPFVIPTVYDAVPDSVTRFVRFPLTGITAGQEQFRANNPVNQTEVCQTANKTKGLKNVRVTAGNSGWYEWYIRLPKKPAGEINIVIECGVIKPNGVAAFGVPKVIEICAAETGEVLGGGICSHGNVQPGESPVIEAALPTITATAFAGPYAPFDFTPFQLTAFRNPGSYELFNDDFPGPEISADNTDVQLLNGSADARVLLKACMDKTIVAKLPVGGQLNAAGQEEADLEAGDLIKVRLDVPDANVVDIYCNANSVRLAGIGEAP